LHNFFYFSEFTFVIMINIYIDQGSVPTNDQGSVPTNTTSSGHEENHM